MNTKVFFLCTGKIALKFRAVLDLHYTLNIFKNVDGSSETLVLGTIVQSLRQKQSLYRLGVKKYKVKIVTLS